MENQENKFKYLEVIRVILALVSTSMIWNGWTIDSTEGTFLGFFKLSPDSLFLFGVFFSMLFIISSVERIFSPISDLFLTKVVITLSITALIIVCTAESSDILNKVYRADASLFPFSRSFLTGIIFFKKVFPFLFSLLMILILCFIFQWIEKMGDKDLDVCMRFFISIKYIIYILSALACILFCYRLNNLYFSHNLLHKKAYVLAQSLDFYESNICNNNSLKGRKIIYLDPSYKYVLVDDSNVFNQPQDVWGVIKYGVNNDIESEQLISNPEPKLLVKPCIGAEAAQVDPVVLTATSHRAIKATFSTKLSQQEKITALF